MYIHPHGCHTSVMAARNQRVQKPLISLDVHLLHCLSLSSILTLQKTAWHSQTLYIPRYTGRHYWKSVVNVAVWCAMVLNPSITSMLPPCFTPVLHHSSAALLESSSATAQSRRWTPGSAKSLSLSFSRNEESSRLFKWSVRVLSSSTLATFLPDSMSSASMSALGCEGGDWWFKDKPFDCSSSRCCCSLKVPASTPDSVSILDINVDCRAAFSSSFRRLLWRPQAGGSTPVGLMLLWSGSPVCSIMLCLSAANRYGRLMCKVKSVAPLCTDILLQIESQGRGWKH